MLISATEISGCGSGVAGDLEVNKWCVVDLHISTRKDVSCVTQRSLMSALILSVISTDYLIVLSTFYTGTRRKSGVPKNLHYFAQVEPRVSLVSRKLGSNF